VCGEVCGERSAKCLLLCSSLKIPPKFHNKLHHAPQPRTQTKSGGEIFSTKYIHYKIFVAQSGFEICGVGVLMQRISERLKSTIAGLGGCGNDHDFCFTPKKCAGTSGETLVQYLH